MGTGNVSVLGSVTGPAEVRLRDELVDRATLEINVRPLRGQGGAFPAFHNHEHNADGPRGSHTGPPVKAAESTLSQLFAPLILLHLYPRALIQLTLQTISSPSTTFTKPFSTDPSLQVDAKGKGKELEAPRGTGVGAGEKAARINAAMMALVDAGVQCRGMLVAVAIAFVPVQDGEADDEEMRLDPTPAEEEDATSTHVFAFSFGQGVGGTEGTCAGVDSVGTFSEDQVRNLHFECSAYRADTPFSTAL